MKHPSLMIICLGILACIAGPMPAETEKAAEAKLTAPKDRQLRVAFVMTEGATMIDFAGPWEVFQASTSRQRRWRRPDMAIGEIAHASGFSDHAHFCRVFRASTGLTPGEARRTLLAS